MFLSTLEIRNHSALASSSKCFGHRGIPAGGRGSRPFGRRFPGLPSKVDLILGFGLRPRINPREKARFGPTPPYPISRARVRTGTRGNPLQDLEIELAPRSPHLT